MARRRTPRVPTLDEFDRAVLAWAQRLTPGPVVIGVPSSEPATATIVLALVELRDGTILRGLSPAAPLAATFLVGAWGRDPVAACRRLATFALAARDDRTVVVEFGAPPEAAWAVLDTAPRPAWLLHWPLRPKVAVRTAAPARGGVRTDASSMRHIEGQVVGPRGKPLPGVHVDLPGIHPPVRADDQGRFRFAIPSHVPVRNLVVHALGKTLRVACARDTGPMTINFPMEE